MIFPKWVSYFCTVYLDKALVSVSEQIFGSCRLILFVDRETAMLSKCIRLTDLLSSAGLLLTSPLNAPGNQRYLFNCQSNPDFIQGHDFRAGFLCFSIYVHEKPLGQPFIRIRSKSYGHFPYPPQPPGPPVAHVSASAHEKPLLIGSASFSVLGSNLHFGHFGNRSYFS